APPVDELDAELERGVRLADELVFVDSELLVEELDRGNGGLANADGPDLLGLHERDPVTRGSGAFCKRGGGHPPGGSPANDHDVANGLHSYALTGAAAP